MDLWNDSAVIASGSLNGTTLEMQELPSSADFLEGNATEIPLDVHSLYEHTPPPYSILSVFVIVLLGVFMRYLQPRLPIPYTVVIMLLGVVYGLIAAKAYPPLLNYTAMTRIDPHWILHLFLPALIFESSFAINLGMFRNTIGSILLLATVGLAIATGLTSVVAKYAFSYGWDWCTSLMFGALISATDPVAVVALLKDVGTSPALGVVLEGESLLNDGTAIILFNIFLALSIPSDDFSGESLAVQSVLTVAGGPLFGFAMGWTLVGLLGHISSDAISEVCLTLTAAYLTFYVSEAVLGISGVLAVVALGVVMNSQRTVISPEVDPWMHEFWDIITYIANTLIFVIVGLTIAEHALFNFENMDWINLLILWPALIVIRLISIVVCLPLIRCVEKTGTCNWKNVLVMSWGGLRGAVSLALAMTVSRDPRLDQDSIGNKVLVHTSGIVMLTLLVNGTTTAKLLSVLGMSRIPEDTISAVDNALRFIFKKRDEKITSLKKDHFLEDVSWGSVTSYTLLQNPYKRSRTPKPKTDMVMFSTTFAEKGGNGAETDIEKNLYNTLDYKAARRIWLQLLKSNFWIQFEHGMVCRRTLLYLSSCVDTALARSEGLVDPEVITGRFTIGHKLTYCQKFVNKLSGHDTSLAGQGRDTVESSHGNRAEQIVEAYWFKSVVHTLLCIHVSCSVLNLIWNFHGHHLDENFFHENVYFVAANGFFCLAYGIEIVLSILAYGFRNYVKNNWNKFELFVQAILLTDFGLDVYVLAAGEAGPYIYKHMLRCFDVLSLLRILRVIRLIKIFFPVMDTLVASLVTHRLLSGFEIGKAFVTAQDDATHWTESFFQNSAAIESIKKTADAARNSIGMELGILLLERPDIGRFVKKRYASRKVLHSMKMDVCELKQRGLLDDKTALFFQKTIESKMEKVSRIPYRIQNPADMLKRIPWITNNRLRCFLMAKAEVACFPKGHALFTVGEEPDGIYLLLSGSVEAIALPNLVVSHQEYNEEMTFTAGDVLGERAILTGKRLHTSYICKSPIQCLFIPLETMNEVLMAFGGLRQEIWNCYGRKLATNMLMAQPTLYHLYADDIRIRFLNRGTVLIFKGEVLELNPNWQLVVLLHGSCVGLPQQIAMEGPKIISKQFQSLHFSRQNAEAAYHSVVFCLEYDYFPAKSRTASSTMAAHDNMTYLSVTPVYRKIWRRIRGFPNEVYCDKQLQWMQPSTTEAVYLPFLAFTDF